MKVNATGPAFRHRGNNGERPRQTQWQAQRMRGEILPMTRPSMLARLFGR